MIALCNTLLTKDGAYANPADIGTTINSTPVTDKVTDVVSAAITTTVPTDCIIDVSVL